MYRRLLLLLVALYAALPLLAGGKEDGSVRFYNQYKQLSSKELNSRAYQYLSEPDKRDSALVCYNIVVNRFYQGHRSDEEILLTTQAFTNLGLMYMTYYLDYQKATEYLLQADKLANEHHLQKMVPYIANGMANLIKVSDHEEEPKYGQILEMRRKAFAACRETNDINVYATTMTGAITDVIDNQHEKKLVPDIKTFLTVTAKADSVPVIRHTRLRCQALLALVRGDTAQAARLMEQSADITWEEPLVSRFTSTSLLDAATLYRRIGQDDNALRLYRKALASADVDGNLDYTYSIHDKIAEIYDQRGDTAQARYHELLYLREKDSLNTQAKLASTGEVKLRYQLEEANHEMQLLGLRNRMLTIIITLAVVVVVVVSLLLWRLYLAYKKVSALHRHLYKQNLELLQQNEASRQAPVKPAAEKNDDEQQLYEKIEEVMLHNPDIYNTGFTVARLAELIGSNTKYVSQAINDVTGKNFNALLAEYRIREACRRLNDLDQYGQMTIEAIAESVGIKSRSNFSTLFKNQTGLTPSEYQRVAREEQKESSGGVEV